MTKKSSSCARKKAIGSPRPNQKKEPRSPASQILELEQLREKALIEIGNAFRDLLPKAIEAARRGKPAALRLIARWFRMPTAQPKYQQMQKQIEELQAELWAEKMKIGFTPQIPDEETGQTPSDPAVQK